MNTERSENRTTLQPRLNPGPLLSKYGIAVTELARMLILCVPGQRLARVQEYAERFDVSTGTAQAALSYLQSAGAATLEARGRLGSYVRELRYPVLWSLGVQRPIVGTMPMPYSRRFEGLATAVSRLGTIRARFHTLEVGDVMPQTAEWETSNVLATASVLATAALTRTETRGGHVRSDYPQQDERWKLRLVATLDPDGELHLAEAPLELG